MSKTAVETLPLLILFMTNSHDTRVPRYDIYDSNAPKIDVTSRHLWHPLG